MAEECNVTLGESKEKKQSCMQWVSVKLRLIEEGATPPNWKYIGLVFAALFSSASTLTFLFPFLPEMVLTFGYSENEKGTYAGLVAASVFAGRIIGSVFWGWLADHSGRKITLILTIALNGLFAGLFGFSKNLITAMLFRFLCGVANGTVGACKTVLYDISDNSNQAFSMSMLSVSWGLGMVMGPALGGFLADPSKKWPNVFSPDGLFGEYPYLLASLFPFISCFFIFWLIFFKFENTFVNLRNSQSAAIPAPDTEGEGDELCPQEHAQKNGNVPLLKAPDRSSKIYLSQSVNSLHMETAQTSAFFAQEMLLKRKNAPSESTAGKGLKSQPSFMSVPNLAQPGSPVMADPTLALFLSTPDIANSHAKTRDSSVVRTNSFGNHYDLKIRTSVDQPAQGVNGNVNSAVHKDIQKDVTVVVSPSEKLLPEDDSVVTQDPYGKANGSYVERRANSNDSFDRDEGDTCRCMEICCSSACCAPCRKSSLFKLLRLKNVWESIALYVMYSFVIIGVEDIFPVFASTRKDYGGLEFSANEIGLAIGTTFLPLLFLQVKLYPFLVSKMGIRKVFLVCAVTCMVCSQMFPTIRLLNDSPAWLWTCLMLVQVPFKLATNCCFAGTSLLINNSVTPDLAGQVNGLAMMATAAGRTLAPAISGALFSWSVTYGPAIGVPFDTSFPFFVLGAIFIITVVECLHLDPRLDQQRK